MSDTAEYPTVKAPGPPAELWGVWNARYGHWSVRFGVGQWASIWCFDNRQDAETLAHDLNAIAPNTYVPYRLIPPTTQEPPP